MMQFSLLGLSALLNAAAAAPAWGDWDPLSDSVSSTPSTTKATTWVKSSSSTSASDSVVQWEQWEDTTSKATTTTTTTTTTTQTMTVTATTVDGGAGKVWSGWDETTHDDGWTGWSSSGSSDSSWQGVSDQSHDSSHYESSGWATNVVDGGHRDDWYDEPAILTAAAPTATLVASPHWTLDKTDPQQIVPSRSNSIYYAPDGSSSPDVTHQMAWIHANFTSETVLLDHSDLCSYKYSSASQTCDVTFKDKTTYDLAQTSWKTDMIIIINDGSCGADESCYLKVSQLNFDSAKSTCTLSTSAINFQSAVDYFDYEWGVHRPNSNTAGTSTSSQTGKGSSTSTSTSTGTDGSANTGPSTGTSSSTSTAPASPGTTSGTTGGSSNSSHAGNYTLANVKELNCTAANGKDGLPAACLGVEFDEDIDEKYGFQSIKDSDFASFAAQFKDLYYTDPLPEDAEDLKDYAADETALSLNPDMNVDFSDTQRLTKRIIGKFIPKKWKKAIAKYLPIKGVTTPWRIDKSIVALNMNVPKQRQTQESPWGQQVLVKSFSKTSKTNEENQAKLDIYCVDCGMQGRAEIFGKAGISVLDGLESLGARLEVDMALTLKVGIDAQIVYTKTFQRNLFEVPLTKTCIKPIICAGPVLKLGADLELKANAKGQLLAGATLAINKAKAEVDLIPPSAKASGWQPEFRPVFEASGSIDLEADFGLPLALALQLDVLNGKFKRDIALVNRPALVAKATVAAAASLEGKQVTGGIQATDGCTGIATSLSIKNDIYVKLPNDKRVMVFNPPPKQLASRCIPLAKTAADTAAKATASSDTAATSGASNTADKQSTSSDASTGANAASDTTETSTTGADGDGSAGSTTNDSKTDEKPADTSVTDADSGNTGEPASSRLRRSRSRMFAREEASASADNTATDDGTTKTSTDDTAGKTSADDTTTASTTSTTTTTSGSTTQNAASTDDVEDITDEELKKAVEVTSDFVTPKHGDKAYNLTNGYSIVTLTDNLKNYQLHTCADGNVRLFSADDTVPDYECGDGFTMQSSDGTIVADAMSRLAIYYPDEMSKLRLSRFRVVDANTIPKGASEIVLIPEETEMETGEKAVLYYPMTSVGETYYPVVCKYDDGSPDKIFLAEDPETALTGLLSEDLIPTLTGGKVTECWSLLMVKGTGHKAPGESDYLSEDSQSVAKTDASATASGTTAAAADSTASPTTGASNSDTTASAPAPTDT